MGRSEFEKLKDARKRSMSSGSSKRSRSTSGSEKTLKKASIDQKKVSHKSSNMSKNESSSSGSDSSSSSDSSTESYRLAKNLKKLKKLARKHDKKAEKDNKDHTSEGSSSDSEKVSKKLRKLKKRIKKEERKTVKRLKKKLKAERKKFKKMQKKKVKKIIPLAELLPVQSEPAEVVKSANVPIGLMERSKAMAPMTMDEWAKRQAVVRKVLDEESGRYRLIKGDGEVLEEIVPLKRHKEINKQATQADGAYFLAHTTRR